MFFVVVALQVSFGAFRADYLTADNGLSRNYVNHIYKDIRGFVWISTSSGIDRYDGYDFLHFSHADAGQSFPLKTVNCVEEDARGDLWIASENGLFCHDVKTGRLFSVSSKFKNGDSFHRKNIKLLKRDTDGKMWVVHASGLSVIAPEEKKYFGVQHVITSPAVEALLFTGNTVLAADGNNVYRLLPDNKGNFRLVEVSAALRNLQGQVNALFADRNFLWIGTSTGLYRYDFSTDEVRYYTNQIGNKTSLSSNTITDIAINSDGEIIVATLIGLNFYNYSNDKFRRITTEAQPALAALNNNFISSLMVDGNTIWIGTEKGGVNLLRPEQSHFTNVSHIENNPASLSKNPVNVIFEDKDGDLFVGTVEGGLNIRRKGSSGFFHAVAEPGNQLSLQHNSVSAINQDYNNDLWIGTWGLGISKLNYADKYKPVFQLYNQALGNTSISSNFIAAIVSDSLNRGIWTGTPEGVDFLDLDKNRYYPLLKNLPESKAIRLVTGIFIDSENRLWVGTGNGLFCIFLNQSDIRKQRVSYMHYHYLLTNSASGIVEKINCIYESKDKTIWLGSNGNGLYSLKSADGKSIIRRYDVGNGLIDNVIYGILEDETGTLWFSTDKGISAFNPQTGHTRSFTVVDGLASNQFYWDAYLKASDGKMYFGHVAGFTLFDPLKFIPAASQNKTEITKISVLNETVFPYQTENKRSFIRFDKNTPSMLRLKEADKAFSIEFSALNFAFPDKIKYAYRLRGFDETWKEVPSNRRFASFTNLKHGSYDLDVKSTNTDGTWSDRITTIKIRVVPPFYKTWLFVLAMVLLGIYLITSYYFSRIRHLQEQETHLRTLVDNRTREIELQKQQLLHQAEKLKLSMDELLMHQDEVSRQNEKLVEQNQKITLQNEELEKLTRKLEEATIDKIGFFTNITHEFRTPITLIIGPVERALKLSSNPKVLEQLNIVRRNSKLLLSLINQLMDFRKIESGKMELVKSNQNFVEFLDDIILPFEDMAKDRGIGFHKQFRVNPPELLFDRSNLQKVIGNLLSNAIKFTPDRGTITVIAGTYFDKKDQHEKLFVSVKDTGKGIDDEEKDKIFERFYQSKHNEAYSGTGQSGTGIGLYLCKQIVELHNGTIEALNLHSGGACFRFIIPIERRVTTVFSVDGKPTEMLIAAPSVEKDQDNKPVLLIVEDNADMRNYIRSILSEEYKVLEAPNGAVGLEVTNRYLPDLIISDVMMPEMDGITFCRSVKTNFVTSHIPMILLTAKSAIETQIDSFQQGADAFLVKPFDEELLKVIISNLNDKRKRLQMNFAESMNTEALNFDNESPDKKFMDKALTVLNENYKDPDFEVPEFIDRMNISRSLLHKKLTNITGQSASRFIRIYRLNVARELILLNRDTHAMNISEIAYEVGFRDPKYFTRCFTKHFGIQPSSFMEKSS